MTFAELIEDASGRDLWFEAEHRAWIGFLAALDLAPPAFCSLMRRSFAAERRSAEVLKAAIQLR